MPRILIVEDDRNSRFLVGQILQRAGYEVDGADNGLTALDILGRDSRYDLIISDIRMAEMDGLTLLGTIREQYPHIPVVLASVHNRTQWVSEAIKYGAVGYLQKPFTKDQLIEAVQNIIPL